MTGGYTMLLLNMLFSLGMITYFGIVTWRTMRAMEGQYEELKAIKDQLETLTAVLQQRR